MNSRDAYVTLNLLSGVGPVRVNQMLSVFDAPERVLAASAERLARVAGIGRELAARIAGWREVCDPDAEKAMAERAEVALVTRADPEYPKVLEQLRDPPLCLYVRGDLAALDAASHNLAVVGSRRTTLYGSRMARHIASGAAFAGWTVTAGLARGIDSLAHEATLDAGGCTIAVLGSGLGRVYPQENVPLARRIAESSGAVVSEFPMMFPPDKRTFPMRNRIISGLTRGTVVVEAGLKSGSLITANQALEQGRTVCSVPGPVDSPQSRGCNRLIKNGAALVENFGDVVEAVSLLIDAPCAGGAQNEIRSPDIDSSAEETAELTDLEQKIYDVVGAQEVSINDIVSMLNVPASQVLGAIVQMEMRRVLRQLPGKRVCRAENAVLA